MAEVINMPRLSDTMEEGTVAKWLKKVGDKIEEGDILAEIETDKATMEFESFNEGTLLYIGIKEGDTAPVDSLLAIIGEKGEDVSGLIDSASSDAKEEKEAEVVAKKEEKKEAPKATGATIPDGVEIIKMPRLSDTMEEGTVATWLKKSGMRLKKVISLQKLRPIRLQWSLNLSIQVSYCTSGSMKGNCSCRFCACSYRSQRDRC